MIDDDVFRVAKVLAEERKLSIGEIISSLAKKGLSASLRSTGKGDFPTFEVKGDFQAITLEDVKRAEDEV